MMISRSIRFLIAMLGVSLMAVACGQQSTEVTESTVESSGIVIPSQIIGLTVAPEDVAQKLEGIERSYIDSLGMFSMRDGELLRATLQVSRLSRIARPNSPGFRRSIIELLGGSTPVLLEIGNVTVFSTSGNKQNVFSWFRGRGMFVLSIHQDYEFPRTLLRKVVSLEVK